MDGHKSWCPPGLSTLSLAFLIYVNDLTDTMASNMRLFADDSSLFTRVNGSIETQDNL